MSQKQRAVKRRSNSQSSIVHSRVSRAGWDWVIDHGTGFFGEHRRGLFEIRQAVYNHVTLSHSQETPTLVHELETLGADGDFVLPCLLYLAECAEAFDKDKHKPEYFLSKDRPHIPLSKTLEGLKAVQSIHRRLKVLISQKNVVEVLTAEVPLLRQRWTRAKGRVNPQDEPPPTEENVDRAFELLSKAVDLAHEERVNIRARELLNALQLYLDLEEPEKRMKKGRRRPSQADLLRVVVGLDEYLKECTGNRQRNLLSRMLGPVSAHKDGGQRWVPFMTDPARLRALINRSKNPRPEYPQKRIIGKKEMDRLKDQWHSLRQRIGAL